MHCVQSKGEAFTAVLCPADGQVCSDNMELHGHYVELVNSWTVETASVGHRANYCFVQMELKRTVYLSVCVFI